MKKTPSRRQQKQYEDLFGGDPSSLPFLFPDLPPASAPLSDPMFVEDPAGGEIAARNRSRAFFAVVRFLRSLKPYLPPELNIDDHLFPGFGDDKDDSIVWVSAGGLWKTPIGEFTVITMFERSDIPPLAQINNAYLSALRQFCEKAKEQDPPEAAKQFRRLIFVADHFYQAYRDDIQKASAALDADNPDPFAAVLEAYGPMSPDEALLPEAALSRWKGKLLTGDPQAVALFRDIGRAVTHQQTGRPSTQWSNEEGQRVVDVFQEEYRFCRALKRTLRQRWRNLTARDLHLADKFHLSRAHVDALTRQAAHTRPYNLALERTANRVNWPLERVRLAVRQNRA